MTSDVILHQVPSRHAAVVRERRAWQDLGAKLIPLLDRVYIAVRAGKIVQTGHNIFIFRDGSSESVTVEIGVEVAAPFEPVDGIVAVTTPGGEVVSTMHRGPYSRLCDAHDSLVSWCKQHQREHANVWWEIYGDWAEDPAQLETEVSYALRPTPSPSTGT